MAQWVYLIFTDVEPIKFFLNVYKLLSFNFFKNLVKISEIDPFKNRWYDVGWRLP